MNKPATKVIIVDEHPLVREGMKKFLEDDGSSEVVAEAGLPGEALDICSTTTHDVVLISASMPEFMLTELIRNLTKAKPKARIIICYVEEDLRFIQDLRRYGADGFIGRKATSGEYSAAVHSAMEDGVFFSSNLSATLFMEPSETAAKANPFGLTGRELDILSKLSNGLCNKEIANELDLSVRTVETHRQNIRRKTNSNTLSDLVRVARSMGLPNKGVDTLVPGEITQSAGYGTD